MPMVNRGGTILPANARAVDVAKRAVDTILPIQQRRAAAAYRVQGIEAILYTRLESGTPCPCKSKEHTLTMLDPDGKAPTGVINRLLTGKEFDVTPYSSKPQKLEVEDGFYIEPYGGKHDDFKRSGPDLSAANEIGFNDVDDNGVGQGDPSLDDLAGLFDESDIGLGEVSCPICYGTAYVGGYTPYRTWRKVWLPTDVDAPEMIDYTSSPWTLAPCAFTVEAVLPKGAVAVDAFRVFNNKQQVAAKLSVDGHVIANATALLAFCDGLPHLLGFEVDEPVSHIEAQLSLSAERAYFEIPKMTKSGDRSMLERTESFQVFLSPEVPQISSMDVIVESMLGKALLVGQVSPWQTRNRSGLGWECQVRVVQPTELFNLLPRRGKVYGQRTANLVRSTTQHQASGYQE